ncbi:thymidylate synthase 3-like [Nylanderia fulva]|uniref:thymidylate synthase 3-like n=1 Tax=Nylanderia fulva TaxID=613905 RepID=UPI0010FB5621|nr:thymidylate synthase 3-like [Nylanderia fulva]
MNVHEEYQYLNIIKDILETGAKKSDRTGIGTLSKFGTMMKYSLKDNKFPLLTTKRVFFKGVVEELLFFVRGQTNNSILMRKGVKIWEKNGSKEFLETLGINRREGDLGPVYGFQWRHFGARYGSCEDDYSNQGIDQLQEVINSIKNNPNSRRHVVVAWNPTDLREMVLPPCHCLFQFEVSNGYLNCALYQRSGDMGLGVPFNIASYSLLIVMVAYMTGLLPGELTHFIGEAHVYLNHIEQLKTQVLRTPRSFPKLFVEPKREIKCIEDFHFDDFELRDYNPHDIIKMDMAV